MPLHAKVFLPNRCNVLALFRLFIRWASRAFLTESRVLCMSSIWMRRTSLIEWPAWLQWSDTGVVVLSCWWFRIEPTHLINKAKTLHPFGINKRDEARQWHIWHLFNHSLPIIVSYFSLNFYCNGFLFTYFFHPAPEEGLYCKPKYRAILFKII